MSRPRGDGTGTTYTVDPVGWVRSTLRETAEAPKQPEEGAPQATLEFVPAFRAALDGLRPGDRVHVLTWLHRADRETLKVHPRGDLTRPLTGVFATRSPDRPNPIGLHDVVVVALDGLRMTVDHLEAVDGTPVLDLKPVLATSP
ncbi:MAG: tRNA (N6-threonylcarbamoyladenosine(37)-N6)-methyltransferase TrmO [Nocardioidaceae bacterium]